MALGFVFVGSQHPSSTEAIVQVRPSPPAVRRWSPGCASWVPPSCASLVLQMCVVGSTDMRRWSLRCASLVPQMCAVGPPAVRALVPQMCAVAPPGVRRWSPRCASLVPQMCIRRCRRGSLGVGFQAYTVPLVLHFCLVITPMLCPRHEHAKASEIEHQNLMVKYPQMKICII